MKHVLLGLTACFLTLSASAQYFKCGTDQMRAKLIAADPTYLQREAEYEEEIQRLIANSAERGDRDVLITIPIVFHIVHLGGFENISNEQVLNAVALLNEDYRALNPDADDVHPAFLDMVGDAQIQFALPTLDPNGNCTNGIDRIYSTETLVGDDGSKLNGWPREKYLNVWTVLDIGDNGTAGYAYKPSNNTDQVFRLLDGIILEQNYIGEIGTGNQSRSTALSHEVGHYLNLDHVWGNNNGDEGFDNPVHMVPACGDDLVEDTPVTQGWKVCPPFNSLDQLGTDDLDWADCNNIDLSTLVYGFDDVTTTTGVNDPTPLVNATDTVAETPRIRTEMRVFSATGVSENSTKDERFAFTGWDAGPVDGELEFAFLPGELNEDKYYSFSMDPSVTDLLSTDSIRFRVKRDANGIRTFAVRSSADNFTANLPLRTGGNPNISIKPGNIAFYNSDVTTEVVITVDPGESGFINIQAPITFRLYGWNAENENGTARVCTNGVPVDLFDKLGGAPQPGGTWSGPSETTGTFDPATMLAGEYVYTVPGAGACAPYTALVTVTLIDPPAIPTITGPSSICAGSNGVLTSSSTTGNVWSPGGQTTPTKSVQVAGSYTVTVSANGCSATSEPFVVASVPQANAGGNKSMTVCDAGSTVPLFNCLTGTPDAGGSWDVGPSPVVDGLFDPATMSAGVYKYVVAGNAPCPNDTANVTVTLAPLATAGTNGTLTICNNAVPTDLFDRLGATPQSGGTWTGPSETTGTFDPTVMSQGAYVYTVAPGATCGDSTATVNVTVTSAPAQPTITGPSTFCEGGSIQLVSSTATAYSWSPGGQTTPAITVSVPGTYAVTITANGCSSTSVPLTVGSQSRASAGKNGSVTACADGVAFSLFPILEGTPEGTGTWTGPSTVDNGLYDPATMDAGDYKYLVLGTAPCPNDSAIVTVTENTVLDLVPGTFEVDDVRVHGSSGLIENVENYMEYSYCSKMFSIGQVARMRAAAFSPTGDRSSTWTEENLQAVGVAEGFQAQCPPTADFYARTVPTTAPANQEIPYSRTACTGEEVQFIDNSGGAIPTGWSWTFQDGEPATSTERNPVVSFTTPGWKTVTLTASNGNGSTTKTDPYAILIGGTPNDVAGVFSEGFEDNDGLFPWLGVNYEGNGTMFQRTTSAAYSGNACAVLNSGYRNPLDLIDQGNEEDIDELLSPTLDLSNLQNGTQLTFRYAYSASTTDLGSVTEELKISSSVDCGKTWIFRDDVVGEELINNGNNPQLPPPAWALKTINLPQSVRVQNVRFRFRYTSSAFSGNLYIDDINITGPVSVEDLTLANFMSLYPNPSNDRFSLAVYGMDRFDTEVIVQDIRGAQIYRSILRPSGQAGMEFSGSQLGLAQGVYMIRASNEAGSSTQKLIISK
ncbi:MAG: T9SS type A sorting domain-containing protein [Flavobacteriales bacterium]|nr:T9SS type A sorting domain-containing protein [Flavobacteriales bacterium]